MYIPCPLFAYKPQYSLCCKEFYNIYCFIDSNIIFLVFYWVMSFLLTNISFTRQAQNGSYLLIFASSVIWPTVRCRRRCCCCWDNDQLGAYSSSTLRDSEREWEGEIHKLGLAYESRSLSLSLAFALSPPPLNGTWVKAFKTCRSCCAHVCVCVCGLLKLLKLQGNDICHNK